MYCEPSADLSRMTTGPCMTDGDVQFASTSRYVVGEGTLLGLTNMELTNRPWANIRLDGVYVRDITGFSLCFSRACGFDAKLNKVRYDICRLP